MVLLYFPLGMCDSEALGRIDRDSMTTQMLMETLVADLNSVNTFQDDDGTFRDIREWKGIRWFTDEDLHILWGAREIGTRYGDRTINVIRIGGSIDLRWIPPAVTKFDATSLALNGTVETADLHETLIELRIPCNRFKGTFEIRTCPRKMKYLSIRNNQLHGTLNLCELPPSIESFLADVNLFLGSLNFSRLPATLCHLNLRSNKFVGPIDFSVIPPNLRTLDLKDNLIKQEVLVIGTLYDGLLYIRLDRKQFDGIVDLSGNIMQDLRIV